MAMSKIVRNIEFLKEILTGKSYAECAKKHGVSAACVSSNVRGVLKILKSYTDIDISNSSNVNYLREKKEEIQKYLSQPLPKVSITPLAREYLRIKLGKHYIRHPNQVASLWEDIIKSRGRYIKPQDALSIQKWLASEGYFVGNIMTDEMEIFALDTLKNSLQSATSQNGLYSFSIKEIKKLKKNSFIALAEISRGDHKAMQEVFIELRLRHKQ